MVEFHIPQPNRCQAEFFRADARFIAYGGARGGGKSWAVRYKAALLALNYAGIRILLLRRTFPELRENHILPLQKILKDIAIYKETDKAFTFPNGSRIRFGYCDSESDVLQYQGQEYDVIFLDEATQFTEYQFQTLTACVRGANRFPKRIYLTCNPGGVGHAWVKRLFVDRAYQGAEKPEDYRFIKATVYDNTALLENDDGYVQMLKNLPEMMRKAWLDGDWDVFVGQYFTMWQRDIHVIPQTRLQGTCTYYFAMDYGMDMLAGYWIAVDSHDNSIAFREVYKSGLTVSEAAELIKSMTQEPIECYFAPPDMWNRHSDTGKSTAEIFAEHGILLVKASNDRVQGWRDMAEWLLPYTDEQGCKSAKLRFMANCENLIRCLPQLQVDERNPNDCAKQPHEITHAPDAIRYYCAGRPCAAVPFADNDDDDEDNVCIDIQVDDFLNFSA